MTSTEPRRGAPGRLRPTRQRIAVAEAMASFDDFRSAQEIHDLLGRRGDPVGLSTVYRTLQRLAEAGEVDMLRSEDGEAIYRRCTDTHHHHLVCRTCGRDRRGRGPGGRALDVLDRGRARLLRRQPHPGDLRHLPRLPLSPGAASGSEAGCSTGRRTGQPESGSAPPYLRSRRA